MSAGLSDCRVCGNILPECAEPIAFQMFVLYSLSPPKTLISSCQPLTSPSSLTHPSPISTTIFLFLFFLPPLLYHSLHLNHLPPSIFLFLPPARLQLFFLTSLSFLPVFQPWLFPPSFTVTLALSCPISLTFRVLLSFPLRPSFCLSATLYLHQHPSPFPSSPLLFLEYVICNASWLVIHLSLALILAN